jgi:phosphate transport system substrate-binding protein
MKLKKIIFVLTIISMGIFAGCEKGHKLIQIKGSDTMLNLGQKIAEEAMKSNKGMKIAVTGGGSGTGIAAIINKTVDIAQSSRDIKEKEIEQAKAGGTEIKEYIVAYDGITVIVNKENPVKNLTTDQLRSIYIGEITNWKELGGEDLPIVVTSRDSSSGTHLFFKEHILRKGNEKGPEEYRKDALFLPANQSIVDEVTKNKAAIGYIGMGYMTEAVHGVSINGIEPTVENVANKSYSISRGLIWALNGEPQGDLKIFLDFMLSEKGQEIVKKEGFVPVK